MSESTSDWIPDSPGEDPDVPDVERVIEGGGVDRGDDVAQDLEANLEGGALTTAPDAPEPPD